MKQFTLFLFAVIVGAAIFIACNNGGTDQNDNDTSVSAMSALMPGGSSCEIHGITSDHVVDSIGALISDTNVFTSAVFFRRSQLTSILQGIPANAVVGLFTVEGSDRSIKMVFARLDSIGTNGGNKACMPKPINIRYRNGTYELISDMDTTNGGGDLTNPCCPWHQGCPNPVPDSLFLHSSLRR